MTGGENSPIGFCYFRVNLFLYKHPYCSRLQSHFIPPAYEDGTDRVFRNVGIYNSDAEELPKRKHNTAKITHSENCIYVCKVFYHSARKNYYYYTCLSGPGNVVGIATGYGLDGPGIESRWGEIYRTCPDRPWGPPSLLYNGYRVFPGGKERPGSAVDPSPPSSALVKKE